MTNKCNRIILSKYEIEKILEFANTHDDNVVLYYETNSIGTEYAIQTQSDLINNEGNIQFITDWENW